MKKTLKLSYISFISAVIIFGAAPQLCLGNESAEEILNSIPWTTIEPIPKPAPKPVPKAVSKPPAKPKPVPPPPPELPPPTPAQLGFCFAGCNEHACRMNCFQNWLKAGGR